MSAKSPDSDMESAMTNGGCAPPVEPGDEDPHAVSNNAATKHAGTPQPDRLAVLAMACPLSRSPVTLLPLWEHCYRDSTGVTESQSMAPKESSPMKIANVSGRLVVVTDEGGIDVETASAGRFGPDRKLSTGRGRRSAARRTMDHRDPPRPSTTTSWGRLRLDRRRCSRAA